MEITDYIKTVKEAEGEETKRVALYELLKSLIGKNADISEIYLEKPVRDKGLVVGRTDISLDRVIIEVKRNLADKHLRNLGIEALKKYLSLEKHAIFGILTDGINFEVFERENLEEPIDRFSFPEDVEDYRAINTVLDKLDKYVLIEGKIPLNTEGIIKIAGYNSNLFATSYRKIVELFEASKDKKDVSLKFNEWKLYMSFIYGEDVEDTLFFRHTYLSLLVKVLCLRLLGFPLNDFSELEGVLSGEYFKKIGIMNYIERDFYSWILEEGIKEQAIDLANLMLLVLDKKFDMKGLSEELEEDILKELYQNIVSREERQLVGEYYTPDWLVQELLQEYFKPDMKILDPSCGSGSFLFFAIRKKKEFVKENTLRHILETVIGFDINPIACLIAKTNYLIALGELLKERQESIYLPVYTTDSLQTMLSYKRDIYGESIEIHMNGEKLLIPFEDNPRVVDEYVDAIVDYAVSRRKNIESKLRQSAKALRSLVESKGNDIWGFVLKNIYKPVFLRKSFDLVIGNPPWISYNRMNKNLQAVVDEFIKGLKLKPHLKTSFDIAVLFFVKCAETYLKDKGTIAFVLPYSVINGDQNSWFRELLRRDYTIQKVYDLSQVRPLFNQASCVVVAKKEKTGAKTEIPAIVFKGSLKKRNSSLETALNELNTENKKFHVIKGRVEYWSYEKGKIARSKYVDEFKRGAEIAPHSFWFVEIKKAPLGYTKYGVPVRSKTSGDEKVKIELEGFIPEDFFYKTILSRRMYPFGFVDFDTVILPIEIRDGKYKLLDYYEKVRGKKFKSASERFWWWLENTERLHENLKEYLEKAQRAWEKHRKDKAHEYNILEWLDYRHNLTKQPVKGNYFVVYTTSGTHPCACIVEKEERLVMHTKTYYANFESFDEALYVCAFINSQVVSELIKPYQSKGLFGGRDIHKLPLEFIPEYDPNNEIHRKIVERAKLLYEKAKREEVRSYLKDVSPNRIRSVGRFIFEFDLKYIDRRVSELLGYGEMSSSFGIALFTDMEDEKELKRVLKRIIQEEDLDFEPEFYPKEVLLLRYNPLEGLSEIFEFAKSAIDFTANLYDTATFFAISIKFAKKVFEYLKERKKKGIFVIRKDDQKEVVKEDAV